MHSISDINRFLAHPAKAASAVFASLFLISFGFHLWQSQKHRSWQFTWPLPCACILMSAGFITREIVAQQHRGDELASVVQGLFYAAAPTFAFSLYLLLLRLLWSRPNTGVTHPGFLLFILGSFSSAIITCTAQGCATYFDPDAEKGAVTSGLALIKASLFLQIVLAVFNACFLALWRGYQYINNGSKIVLSIFVLMSFVTVRNIFRTVQIFMSPVSPIWTSEAYFWVFDACMMLIYTTLFHVMHSTISPEYGNEREGTYRPNTQE